MEVAEKHPELTTGRLAEFTLMRDAEEGETAIKSSGITYLPKPSGFKAQSDDGDAMYAAYRVRAQFPEILSPSLSAMVGIVHQNEVTIEIPDGMAWIWEDADGKGLDLESFHRRITRHLLWLGRYGVLVDAPQTGGNAYMTGYSAEAIINWDQGFYVLDESGRERDGFQWRDVTRHRVLRLEEGRYVQEVYVDGEKQADAKPMGQGARRLDRVPFVVASSRDLTANVRTPPLIGVARAALAIYQLNADYRHQLYMSGQETMVAINGEAPTYVGAGVVHEMSGTEGVEPDLKYVSPTCAGIEAHQVAIRDNREAAVMAGARLLEQAEGVEESGAARKLRFASETATLTQIAQVSCAVLEQSLRNIAVMSGQSEDAVTVRPPADLMDSTMTPQEAHALVTSWQAGAFSYQTLYENLQRGRIASPERDHEAELALIDDEEFRPEPDVSAVVAA